jgi:hypothetical protein
MTIPRDRRSAVVLLFVLTLMAAAQAAETSLSVEFVRLRGQKPGRANGRIALRATFSTTPPDDVLDASSGFQLVMTDGATLDQTVVWASSDCEPTSRGGFVCRLPVLLWKLRLDPVRGSASSWRATARMKRLAVDGPFAPPVSVRITTDGLFDRVGETANCTTSANGALTCRAP